MAKKRNLLGDGSLFGEALYGLATGLGATGYDPESRMRRSDMKDSERRKEQTAAMDRALKERMAMGKSQGTPLPSEVMVDLPGATSNVSGNQQNPGVSPQDGSVGSVPHAASDGIFGGPIGGSGLTEMPLFSNNVALPPSGELPPPVRSPLDSAHDYMIQVKKLPLSQAGRQKASMLQGILDAAENPNIRPGAREELLKRLHQEKDRMRIEEDVEVEPTIQDEMANRVFTAPNGIQQIRQPDGRIDVKDMTSKADLERINLEHQSRTQVDQLQSQAKEQRRQERLAIQKQQLEQQQQSEKERADRFKAHYDAETKAKPAAEHYDDARKDLEAQYKTLNPKLPMRKFSPNEIQAYADAKINMNFSAKERFMNSVAKQKVSPEDALRSRMKADPETFKEEYEQMRKRLSGDTLDPVSPAQIFEAMIQESPEALESEYDKFLAERNKGNLPTTEQVTGAPQKSLMESFVSTRQANPTDVAQSAMLRSLFGRPSDQGDEPASPSDSTNTDPPVNPLRQDGQVDPARKMIIDSTNMVRDQSAAIKEFESLMSDRQGNPVDFGTVVDVETLNYLDNAGSKNPLDDAATEMIKALRTGARNINLMSTMERDGAKMAFPLVTEDNNAALDAAGVRPGEIYRDGLGNIKERTAAKKKRKKPLTLGK